MDAESNEQQEIQLEQVVLTQVMRMNATINALVAGLLVGCSVLLATLWLVIKGGEVVGPHLGLLDQFFFGYSVTFVGSLIGFFYGFAVGFVIGYFISIVYNWLTDLRARLRPQPIQPKSRTPLSKPEGDLAPVRPGLTVQKPSSNGSEGVPRVSKSRS